MGLKQAPYNRYGLIALLATTAFSLLWIGYVVLTKSAVDLGEFEEPTAKDKAGDSLLTETDRKTPWLASDSLIAHGGKVYKIHCAVCHGPKGLGDGTPGLEPPPRNLVEGKWKRGGSAKALFITFQEGIAGTSMVSFKHLTKTDRWALVHYVQSLTKNKINDDPKTLEEFGKTAQ